MAAVISVCGLEGVPGDMRWWISILCVGLICTAVHGKHMMKLWAWRPSRAIGKYNRFIYFWHIPAIWVFLKLESRLGLSDADPRLKLGLFLLLLAPAAAGARRCFEKERRPG